MAPGLPGPVRHVAEHCTGRATATSQLPHSHASRLGRRLHGPQSEEAQRPWQEKPEKGGSVKQEFERLGLCRGMVVEHRAPGHSRMARAVVGWRCSLAGLPQGWIVPHSLDIPSVFCPGDVDRVYVNEVTLQTKVSKVWKNERDLVRDFGFFLWKTQQHINNLHIQHSGEGEAPQIALWAPRERLELQM